MKKFFWSLVILVWLLSGVTANVRNVAAPPLKPKVAPSFEITKIVMTAPEKGSIWTTSSMADMRLNDDGTVTEYITPSTEMVTWAERGPGCSDEWPYHCQGDWRIAPVAFLEAGETREFPVLKTENRFFFFIPDTRFHVKTGNGFIVELPPDELEDF